VFRSVPTVRHAKTQVNISPFTKVNPVETLYPR
jgi:hypothetical protein